MRVKCPRCGKIWEAPQGTDAIDCNCHLFCEDGEKPSDCSVTKVNFRNQTTLQVGYPTGLHNAPADESDDPFHITYHCSTHDKYYYKVPIMIPCDWDRWFSHRAPKELRDSLAQY